MKNRPQSKTARPLLGALLAASLLMQSGITQAATTPLSVSNTPLFVTTATLMPNIVLTLDDSGSMAWAYVPDSIGDNQPQTGYNSNTIDSTKRFKSSYVNGMYYNPAISYTPPPKFDNNVAPDLYPNSPFTAAYTNGFDTSRGTVNLSTNYTAVQSYDPDPSGLGQWFAGGANPFPVLTVNYSYSCTGVNFSNHGANDTIDVANTCTGVFANITSGTVLTVTGSTDPSRNKSYTVSSPSANSVNVGSQWNSNLNGQTVTLSWTITASNSNKPAYYYMFWSQLSAYPKPASCDNTTNDDDCYIPILVGSTSSSMVGPTLSPADLAAGNAAAKQQNFANWYSYYRTRNLAIKTGAMRALDSMDGNVRLAWQSLNKCTSFGTTCQGTDSVNRDNRIWRLNATDTRGYTHKQDLYEWLSRLPANGGTPMRNAAIRAGNYFTNTIKGGTDTLNVHSPFAQDPQLTAGTFYSCRRNVSMLMTDGLWNSDTGAYGNADSTAVVVPSGPNNVANYNWTPDYPYKDTNSLDLADIAFHFWSTDLQPGLSDNLSPIYKSLSSDLTARWINPRNDPATWQHLITYTVGLGLTSSLVAPYPVWGGNTYAGDYNNLVTGPPTGVAWPNTFGSDTSSTDHPARVADLWHAAIASRGKFFSAENAQDVVNAFQAILTDVTAASASAAALAANSTSINTGAFLYQAKFDSTDWSGHLLALPVDGQGNVGAQVWDAATLLPSAASRNILTMVGSTGKTFLWGNLSGAQQTQLNTNPETLLQDSPSRGQDRLNWLRGDQSLEEQFSSTNPNAIFRSRTQAVLGDIVNSDPVYSQKEDFGYSGLPASAAEGASYAAYVAIKQPDVNNVGGRLPYLYVGANDGMLHAFNATPDIASNSGKEAFAYVPAAVYPNLSKLTDVNYGSAANPHQYYVDGAPAVGDAYINGAWSTVLVGGLNGGGKSVYALRLYKDGTAESPAGFSASQVMWEYSDANDLGLTYSQPQIARLNNGQWAAIFGNGYNSTSGKAFLYVVNLADGTLIAKIPAGVATSNGLSTPVLYDANNDKIADFAYAGDLQGNMWKFDLTTFTVSYSGVPLFTARNASSQVQPITAQPKVGSHPNGGVLVYFGTGQYLATGDPSNTQVQSFYSIWDNGSVVATTDRSQLQAQTIVSQTSATTDLVTQADSSTPTIAFATRVTSSNSVDYAGGKRGWYMDLVPPSGPAGERVVSAALLKFDRVIFVTLIPSANDPCVPGGDSWIMELTALTGAVPATSVFDFNGDDKFDNFDQSSGGVISGVKSTQGITKTPAWLDKDNSGTVGFKELSGSSGGIMSLKNKGAPPPAAGLPSRVFWQQIM